MCRKSILVVSCVLLLSPVSSVFGDLVGWWTFDETSGSVAADGSGQGNNGTVVGTALWVPGKIGGAFQFNGSTYINCGRAASLNIRDQITIAFWFKVQAFSNTWEVFLAKGDGAYRASRSGGTGNATHFGISASNYFDAPTVITDNQWHHYCATYNGATAIIYIDGKEDARATYSGQIGDSSNYDLLIGENQQATGRLLHGLMDDIQIYNNALTVDEIQKIMTGLRSAALAGNPSPEDEAVEVLRDAVLSWKAGEYAATHNVYFGTSFEDVNAASTSDPRGVLASQGQSGTDFDPDGVFEYGQTYYWRIDEVNGAPDYAVTRGETWSFTVETYAYPITGLTVNASGQEATSPAMRTIDGSGLKDDLHSTDLKESWMVRSVPAWIQYTFDREYVLDELRVWNANSIVESWMGLGAKDVTVEYSTDGQTWTAIENVPQFAQEAGVAPCPANTTIRFGEVSARHVRLTINTVWGSGLGAGLSEVRFYYVPVQAFEPDPADGATGVHVDAEFNWRPGRKATSHQVYLGTDANAVAEGTMAGETVTDHRYTPDTMNYATTYYWKVDEVGDSGTYEGDVWSFTSAEYGEIDTFEAYNDDDNRLYDTWLDGYLDKSSGSQVGYIDSSNGTFGETAIVHSGRQSMPLFYNNTASPYYSEAKRIFNSPQDWTSLGVKSLAITFAGKAGNAGQLYLKINNTKVPYDGDATDLARSIWQPWNIDLSKVSGANAVRSLTIGIEGSGATGTLYIDDIRLYPKAPEWITPTTPDAAGLAARYTLDKDAKDSSANALNATVEGNAQWLQGKLDGAMQFNGANIRVVAPHIALDNRSFTVAMWINPVLYAAEQVVFSQTQSSATNTDLHFRLGGPGAASGNVPAGGVRMAFYANDLDTTGGVIQDNEWYHITFRYDFENRDRRIYIDGVLAAHQTSATPYLGATGNTIIGAWGTGQWFSGLIDDVRIYQRALSDGEIAGLAGRTLPIHKAF
jgi:hypothetical protein